MTIQTDKTGNAKEHLTKFTMRVSQAFNTLLLGVVGGRGLLIIFFLNEVVCKTN